METIRIADSSVSRIGLGTWAIGGSEWGEVPEDEAIATCLSAIERGINLIDTAPIYGRGRAEEIVGKAIRAHGRRDDFYVATKAGLLWNSKGVFADSRPERIRQELEDSLRRLGIETIDLYQAHWPDTLIPVEETAALLAGFVREGKVKAVGVSNYSIEQMERFGGILPIASNQPPFNLFEREQEQVLEYCAGKGIAVLTYSSLCRSLLGGRVHRGMVFDAKDIRSVDPKFKEPRFSQYITAVERLSALAEERFGKTLPQLAVRWVLDHPGPVAALWGAKRPDQLDAVQGVSGWRIDAQSMAEIGRIVSESVQDPVGPEYLTPGVRPD